MPFGIIFEGVIPDKRAHFYIPTTPGSSSASHVYLGSAPRFEILNVVRDSEKTILVDIPQPVGDFLPFLVDCNQTVPHARIAVVVPVSDDPELFTHVKNSHLPVVLRYRLPVTDSILNQFKCLRYGAVLVDGELGHVDKLQVSQLLCKSSTPSLITFSRFVKEPQQWHSLAATQIPPFSDYLITPLQPLVQDMPVSVYQEFEKDTTKYSQYQRAIELAMCDLHERLTHVKILVIGPGRGPLLKMVADHTLPQDTVTVVEKNPHCLPFLEHISCGNATISLIHGDCRRLTDLHSYDLVVSELLGSFGCNEACPEILNFKSDAVFIPESFASSLHPIYSDLLEDVSKQLGPAGPGPIPAPVYLANLTSVYTISEPQQAFEFCFPGPTLNQVSSVLSFSGNLSANALCGYFSATLYGPYKIDISPGSHADERCSSWYPMVFPIKEVAYPIKVEMRRCSTGTLWYEYTVNGVPYRSPKIGLD